MGRPSTVPTPATRPSAGVRAIRSSSDRRRRCAAMTSGPYSTKLPGSTRSATFSRVVRCPVLRRRATPSGRLSSRPASWRSTTSARSALGAASPSPARGVPPAGWAAPAGAAPAGVARAGVAREGVTSAGRAPAGAAAVSSTTASRSPDPTASPGATTTLPIVPAAPASTTYSIFMDSTITTGDDGSTRVPGAATTRTTDPRSGERTSAMQSPVRPSSTRGSRDRSCGPATRPRPCAPAGAEGRRAAPGTPRTATRRPPWWCRARSGR